MRACRVGIPVQSAAWAPAAWALLCSLTGMICQKALYRSVIQALCTYTQRQSMCACICCLFGAVLHIACRPADYRLMRCTCKREPAQLFSPPHRPTSLHLGAKAIAADLRSHRVLDAVLRCDADARDALKHEIYKQVCADVGRRSGPGLKSVGLPIHKYFGGRGHLRYVMECRYFRYYILDILNT